VHGDISSIRKFYYRSQVYAISDQRRQIVLTAEKIRKAAVIGSGAMGHGIAELLAMNGYHVAMVDVNDEILQKAKEKRQQKT
jgi:enoyl-CoA hydratase/3-hydroxyacyl-CoA dehydrogenase